MLAYRLLDNSHLSSYPQIKINLRLRLCQSRLTEIMMQKQFSIADAKNRLPAIVHSVEDGAAVELTRRGKPVAVIISKRDYELLSRTGKGFWTALSDFHRNLAQMDVTIADADFAELRDRSPGREEELCR